MRYALRYLSSFSLLIPQPVADILSPHPSQQILHTLTPPTNLPKGEPDLRPSTLPAIPFESDTLKSNFMRVYATLGIWTIYGAREAMRLMSWEPEHRRRTRIWCIVSCGLRSKGCPRRH